MDGILDQDLVRLKPENVTVSAAMAEQSPAVAEVYKGVAAAASNIVMEVEQVKCECCGLAEDCTPAYILQVRGLYCGKWVCGLCAEAVKEEYERGNSNNTMDMKDALEAHMSICRQFNKPEKKGSPVSDLAAAMRRLMRRGIDGSISPRSAPSSPRHGSRVGRTSSYLTTLSRK